MEIQLYKHKIIVYTTWLSLAMPISFKKIISNVNKY